MRTMQQNRKFALIIFLALDLHSDSVFIFTGSQFLKKIVSVFCTTTKIPGLKIRIPEDLGPRSQAEVSYLFHSGSGNGRQLKSWIHYNRRRVFHRHRIHWAQVFHFKIILIFRNILHLIFLIKGFVFQYELRRTCYRRNVRFT